jgi:hypothetical protein
MNKALFLLLLLAFVAYGQQQADIEQDSVEYKINPTRLAIIGGTIVTSYTAIYLILLKDGWWTVSKGFHFEKVDHDFGYASNMDKFGHFYTGAITGELFAMSYDWIGMSPFASALLAGITVSVTQIAIEFKDGFAPYGYSIYDAIAGSLGGFYAMGKRFIPAMQYVDYKFTYFPNYKGYWRDGELINDSFIPNGGFFVDDYYGGNQTYWLSFRVAKMLPHSTRDYYPQWLAFAFGWGIDDGHYEREWGSSRYEFYFSMDYDFEAIVRPRQTWSKNAVKILNLIKFPAPAVRLGRNPEFFPLHPWYGFSVTF